MDRIGIRIISMHIIGMYITGMQVIGMQDIGMKTIVMHRCRHAHMSAYKCTSARKSSAHDRQHNHMISTHGQHQSDRHQQSMHVLSKASILRLVPLI